MLQVAFAVILDVAYGENYITRFTYQEDIVLFGQGRQNSQDPGVQY